MEMRLDVPKEIGEVLRKVNIENPDEADVSEFRKLLSEHAEIARQVGDLARIACDELVERNGATVLVTEFVKARVRDLRRDLGFHEASPLERLLIEHVVLCWVRLNYTEHGYTERIGSGDLTLSQADWWERRLSATQQRYLRACQTLVRVRKLVRSTVQVNIATQGGQQVNVAGDLKVNQGTGPSGAIPAEQDGS